MNNYKKSLLFKIILNIALPIVLLLNILLSHIFSVSVILLTYISITIYLFLLHIISTEKSGVLLIIGLIFLLHLVIFPLIYLSIINRNPSSFEFEEGIYSVEEGVYNIKKNNIIETLSIEEIKTKNRLGIVEKILLEEDNEMLEFLVYDLIHVDSLDIGNFVLIPSINRLEAPIEYTGNSIPRENNIEDEKLLLHIFPLEYHPRPSTNLKEMFVQEKYELDKSLKSLNDRITSVIDDDSFWKYDNIINYSIKIFLLESPMKPKVGFVNQLFVLHIALVSVLVSIFFHLMNKKAERYFRS